MQQKILIGLALTLTIVIFIAIYWATEAGRQEAASERQRAEAVERGAGLYISNCALCHGFQGEGGIGPRLQGTQLDEDVLERIIARGVPGTAMSAWSEEDGGPYKRHEIRDLVTFIKNWDSALLEELMAEEVTTPTPTPTPPSTPTPGITPTPTATPVWTPVASLEDIRYDPDTPESILLSGKRTFQSSCPACHDLPTVEQIKGFASDEALLEVGIAMTEIAELPSDFAEKVIRYLLALRYDTAP